MFIACTGHRPGKLNDEYDGHGPVSASIRGKMTQIIHKYQPERILTGMALGVDMLWAEVGIVFGIQVVACIPCVGQGSNWPEASRARYNSILLHPNVSQVLVSKEPYRPELMQERNRWMVDHSDLLLAVWDKSRGGTANCVEYAMAKDRPIIYIDVRPIIKIVRRIKDK